MAVFNNDDVDLYYETHGNGAPLMLIAGIASDSQSWIPVVDALSKRFLLIMPDNRGAGRTRPMDCPLSIPLMARDCAALMAHLGFAKAHVAGHSMGGAIALELALHAPQLVDHLVLAATRSKMRTRTRILFDDMAALRAAGTDEIIWFKLLFQWLFDAPFFTDVKRVEDAAKLANSYAHKQSAANFARQLNAIKSVNFDGRLGQVKPRTLVLMARNDKLFPLEEAQDAFSEIPNAERRIIDNAAHSLHWDNPIAFAEAIESFIQ